MPIVDVVNPSSMRVRSKVNQADIGEIKPALPSASASTPTPTWPSPAGWRRSRLSA